jgi:hypothetical protein
MPAKLRCATLAGALMLWAPAAFAQPEMEGPRENAPALCIVAGERLARADVRGTVLAWRQILHVMEATEDRRRAALDSARAARLGQVNWPHCASRDYQVRYLVAYAPEERLFYHLAEEPGTVLDAAVARRLNRNARCLAAAELLSGRGRSRSARAVRTRTIQEIGAAPGSAVGKELVVDVARFIVADTSRASQIIQTC